MRADYINPDIYTRVYHLLVYENALALRTSLETGLRISDVLNIEVKNFHGTKIDFIAQKTGKKGVKKISADLAKRLRSIAGERWIFTGRSGCKPRTRQTVWKDVKKAADQLNIKDNLTCHSARKTYAVELFHDQGINKVQKELQHNRLDTTMIYAFADILNGNRSKMTDNEDKIEQIYKMVLEIYKYIFGEKK